MSTRTAETSDSATLEPSPLSGTAISEYAERIGYHHDIYSADGYANLDKLLGAVGGRTVKSRDIIVSHGLNVRRSGDFDINIAPSASRRRDRAAIAHELGHYFLHYLHPGRTGSFQVHHGELGSADVQANRFAAALLMPAEHYHAAYRELDGDAWAIGERFGVSQRAEAARAAALGRW